MILMILFSAELVKKLRKFGFMSRSGFWLFPLLTQKLCSIFSKFVNSGTFASLIQNYGANLQF